MGFYLLSGIQSQDLESKFLCHVSEFNGLMVTSPLQSTDEKGSFCQTDTGSRPNRGDF